MQVGDDKDYQTFSKYLGDMPGGSGLKEDAKNDIYQECKQGKTFKASETFSNFSRACSYVAGRLQAGVMRLRYWKQDKLVEAVAKMIQEKPDNIAKLRFF